MLSHVYRHSYSALWGILLLLPIACVNATADKDTTQETGIYSALSLGTAWAITRQHVVTNYHVVADTKNLRLVTPNQFEIPVKVVASDPANDLAILALQGKARLGATLPISSKTPGLGTPVFTIGYPHPDLMGTSPKLTAGHINALFGIADDPRIYQVDVPVQAGNSGGPLLNMYGEVVAIITSKLNAIKLFERTGDVPQNVNYAIKIDRLSTLLNKAGITTKIKRAGFDNKQNLETLAGKSLNSVLIVAGDTVGGKRKKDNLSYAKIPGPSQAEKKDPEPIVKKKYVIYSYAEPGNYDRNENIVGSRSIRNYSKNTAKLINTHISHMKNKNINIDIKSGKYSRNINSELDDSFKIKQYCRRNEADYIFSSYSEKNPGAHFRYVTFKVADCQALRNFRKTYTLERDELNDGFGYEMALHSTFKDFLIKIPPFITFAN